MEVMMNADELRLQLALCFMIMRELPYGDELMQYYMQYRLGNAMLRDMQHTQLASMCLHFNRDYAYFINRTLVK
jgi:hypothetical protein